MSQTNYRLVLSCCHKVSTGRGRWEKARVGDIRWCRDCGSTQVVVDKTSFQRTGVTA